MLSNEDPVSHKAQDDHVSISVVFSLEPIHTSHVPEARQPMESEHGKDLLSIPYSLVGTLEKANHLRVMHLQLSLWTLVLVARLSQIHVNQLCLSTNHHLHPTRSRWDVQWNLGVQLVSHLG